MEKGSRRLGTHTHIWCLKTDIDTCASTHVAAPLPPCTHRASSERLLEVIVSEMFGVGS